ncbi:MAG: GNAT family N-acetyltransferase [Anaerolineae bacterium]
MTTRLQPTTDADQLVALLADADKEIGRIRAMVETHTGYFIINGTGEVIGAALLDWQPEESEIIYIAVELSQRGKGYGKQAVALIVAEAAQQSTAALIVGTANASLDQIAFYQKCGFRMDSIRKDYFDYFTAPVYENGIRIRDMLVLRHDLNT